MADEVSSREISGHQHMHSQDAPTLNSPQITWTHFGNSCQCQVPWGNNQPGPFWKNHIYSVAVTASNFWLLLQLQQSCQIERRGINYLALPIRKYAASAWDPHTSA